MAIDATWNFVRAKAGTENVLMLATVPDLDEYREEWFTRVSRFDRREGGQWFYDDYQQTIVDFTVHQETGTGRRYFVSISNEGEIHGFGDQQFDEEIPGAGVYRENRDREAPGGGYMHAISHVGEHLYACGDSGQFFKRVSPDNWQQLDLSLLEDVRERTLARLRYESELRTRDPSLSDDEILRRALDEGPFFQTSLFYDVAGPAEDQIYIAGSINEARGAGFVGGLWFWTGRETRRLDVPTTEVLSSIHVQSADIIWVIGRNGTLLRGNHRDGFVDLSGTNDNQLWQSITMLDGVVYLASGGYPQGLFRFDPHSPGAGIVPVRTGLDPEHTDVHIVDAAGDALWSIGFRDIARFDGRTWERIHHPDNPRIGN